MRPSSRAERRASATSAKAATSAASRVTWVIGAGPCSACGTARPLGDGEIAGGRAGRQGGEAAAGHQTVSSAGWATASAASAAARSSRRQAATSSRLKPA
jgi:hypothetical protein